jgi:hypothetical protein
MKKLKFHERFKLPVDLEKEQRRFVQGMKTLLRTDKLNGDFSRDHRIVQLPRKKIKEDLAIYFGEGLDYYRVVEDYIPSDFLGCLEALEEIYKSIYVQNQGQLDFYIQKLLKESRIDLEVEFENGQFFPKGSELLDEKLIDDILNCLDSEEHADILPPFSTGLLRYKESIKDQSKLKDVIDNMYEALEAFAKYINKNDKDLSGNKELLIKNLKLNDYYKNMLFEYIGYANEFRHAAKKRQRRPGLNKYEVEAFIYLTGLFIRLGIKRST